VTGGLLPPPLALGASPLLAGVINRTKARFAGRRGPPLLQPYYDLARLLRKGAVYSRTTTWVFRAAPVAVLGATLVAVLLLPFGSWAAPLAFRYDLVLFAYLLGAARFATVLGALDTGSSFEGMGASRELLYAALAEPALFLALLAMVSDSGALSLSQLLGSAPSVAATLQHPAATLLIVVTLFVVLLAETARVPFDDPATHLELTMVHEVMVLDHGGPDLALFQYASALKLWALGVLVVGVVVPAGGAAPWLVGAAWFGGMVLLAVIVGVVESTMARLRLPRTPQLLVGASLLAMLALLLRLGSPA
jgi:formate hydrogenlyase subunit 4